MNTYLKVPYSEKEKVKALGARWDSAERAWFIPPGISTEPFAQWLLGSVAVQPSQRVADFSSPIAASKAMNNDGSTSLSQYMQAVSEAMTRAAPPAAWISAELSEFKARNNYWMLSLVEYDDKGKEISKAQGMVFGAAAAQINKKIREANVNLEKGVKLLLKVKAEMDARYGFRLQVIDIDPKFTLGDMAAKLEQIRTLLKAEGSFDLQKHLPSPQDFTSVAIIAPEGAAGLGDFMREADILQSWKLTSFDVHNCVFQGDKAAAAITKKMRELYSAIMSGQASYDALVIIRGGGAVTDMAWLNDLNLTRAVAKFPIPVFTGIGHEKDNTSLDEVSHRRFDTPSKVVNHIMATVVNNAQGAMNSMLAVLKDSQRVITLAESNTTAALNQVRSEAEKRTQRALSDATTALQSIEQNANKLLEMSMRDVEAMAREVLGLSPKKTLERGYALIRSESGAVLTSQEAIANQSNLVIQMHDGQVAVQKQ